jgi:sugar phosphate isomerase/epimerase
MSDQPTYPDFPDVSGLPSYVKETASNRKLSNLLLSFLDFHITEEAYQDYVNSDFKMANLPETIADLKKYGYDVELPKSAAEYRDKVYPMIMEMHAKAGYWGVQIPVGGVYFDADGILTEESKALLKQQKQICEQAGLNISTVGGSWVADWTQCLKPHIEATSVLGAQYMYGPMSTPFLYFPDEVAGGGDSVVWAREQCKRFSQLLKEELGPYAAKHGVILCEEPLQRFERMPIRLREATELAEMTQINEFNIMIDMCHEYCDGEGPEKYKSYVDRLYAADSLHGAHISAVHRGKLYESWFNKQYFKDFFGPLFAHGFEDEISIETFDATDPVVAMAKVNREKFEHPIGVMINQLVYATYMLHDI